MTKTPLRFRPAGNLAWAASIAAVVLAVGGRGAYDPTVAVLTATLVAVIWYTYWSYVAANREEASHVLLDLAANPAGPILIPKVQNPTRRTIEARVFLKAWVERFPIDTGPFYAGEEPIYVGPLEGWSGALDLRQEVNTSSGTGPNRIVHVRFHLAWTDDLGESGKSVPKYWLVEVGTFVPAVVSAVLGESDIRRQFSPLPGFQF